MEWFQRAEQRRKELGLTQKALMPALGVSTRGAVGHYLNGRRQPDTAQLMALARVLKCSVDWLYGETRTLSEPVGAYDVAITNIPVVGTTQGGPDKHWMELGYPAGWGDEFVDAPAKHPHTYALRVSGGSMSPRMREGDVITVNPTEEPMPGDEVVVATKGGEILVKQLTYMREDEVALDSIADGEPRIVRQMSDIEFIHVVIGIHPSKAVKKVKGVS